MSERVSAPQQQLRWRWFGPLRRRESCLSLSLHCLQSAFAHSEIPISISVPSWKKACLKRKTCIIERRKWRRGRTHEHRVVVEPGSESWARRLLEVAPPTTWNRPNMAMVGQLVWHHIVRSCPQNATNQKCRPPTSRFSTSLSTAAALGSVRADSGRFIARIVTVISLVLLLLLVHPYWTSTDYHIYAVVAIHKREWIEWHRQKDVKWWRVSQREASVCPTPTWTSETIEGGWGAKMFNLYDLCRLWSRSSHPEQMRTPF